MVIELESSMDDIRVDQTCQQWHERFEEITQKAAKRRNGKQGR